MTSKLAQILPDLFRAAIVLRCGDKLLIDAQLNELATPGLIFNTTDAPTFIDIPITWTAGDEQRAGLENLAEALIKSGLTSHDDLLTKKTQGKPFFVSTSWRYSLSHVAEVPGQNAYFVFLYTAYSLQPSQT